MCKVCIELKLVLSVTLYGFTSNSMQYKYVFEYTHISNFQQCSYQTFSGKFNNRLQRSKILILFLECKTGFLAAHGEPCKTCPTNSFGWKCSESCNCGRYERFAINHFVNAFSNTNKYLYNHDFIDRERIIHYFKPKSTHLNQLIANVIHQLIPSTYGMQYSGQLFILYVKTVSIAKIVLSFDLQIVI